MSHMAVNCPVRVVVKADNLLSMMLRLHAGINLAMSKRQLTSALPR